MPDLDAYDAGNVKMLGGYGAYLGVVVFKNSDIPNKPFPKLYHVAVDSFSIRRTKVESIPYSKSKARPNKCSILIDTPGVFVAETHFRTSARGALPYECSMHYFEFMEDRSVEVFHRRDWASCQKTCLLDPVFRRFPKVRDRGRDLNSNLPQLGDKLDIGDLELVMNMRAEALRCAMKKGKGLTSEEQGFLHLLLTSVSAPWIKDAGRSMAKTSGIFRDVLRDSRPPA